MSFLKSLKTFFTGKKPTKVVEVPIDPDSVKDSHLIKAIANENAELKGTKAKLEKEISLFRQRDKDVREEENVKISLDEKKKELRAMSLGKIFSFKSFFGKLFRDKKFRERLGIFTFDRSERLSDFGDFGIAQDGSFVLIDKKGNLVMKMRSLKDMFQSVGALGVDINSGKMPVWMDGDWNPIENVMEYEAPELIPDGSGRLKFSKARKKPVFDTIQDLINQLGETHSELAESEMINTQLQNKVDKLEQEVRVHQDMAETSRAELTDNEQRLVGIDKVFRNTQRDMIRLQNLNTINEDEISKMKEISIALRDEAEREGVKISDEKALELIERVRGTIVNELPEMQPQQPQTPEKATPQG